MSTFSNSEDPDEMQLVYSVCKGKRDLQTKEFYLKDIT